MWVVIIVSGYCSTSLVLKPEYHNTITASLPRYYGLLIYCGYIWLNRTHSTMIAMLKLRSGFALMNDTPYLALMGELWGVFHEFVKEKYCGILRAHCMENIFPAPGWRQHDQQQRRISINTLRVEPNDRHFADHIFKHIFLNENVGCSIQILLKLVRKWLINNNPAMIQIMASQLRGDNLYSELMLCYMASNHAASMI